MLDWIRISANVYDYLGKISIPEFDGALGFSYVWTEGISTVKTLQEIKEIAIKNHVEYIRLVKDCLSDQDDEQLTLIAEVVGPPMFYQKKEFRTPSKCYWGYLKPFLYCDEYIYPCSSMVLNSDADKQFHESYRLCHWSEIEQIWEDPVRSLVDIRKCDRCVFTQQNDTLEYCLSIQRHEDFI
jgi:hypothetical protein